MIVSPFKEAPGEVVLEEIDDELIGEGNVGMPQCHRVAYSCQH